MSEFKFCPNCGTEIQQKAAFCTACGHPLTPERDSSNFWLALSIFTLLAVIAFGLYRHYQTPPATQQAQTAPPADQAEQTYEQPVDDSHMKALKAAAENEDPAALMNLIDHQLEASRGNWAYMVQAAESLDRLLTRYPEHAYSLKKAGNVAYSMGNAQRAIDFYERYLALQPDDANVHTDLGTAYLELGDAGGAIGQYERAISLFPNFYNAHFNMAYAYETLGKEEDAAQFKTRAEQIEAEFGRQLAPEPQLPRLPETAASANEDTLAAFFREHEIVGPKMTGFEREAGRARLIVRQFPMQAMPPFARQAFDRRVKAQLAKESQPIVFEIRDHDSGEVLADYKPEP